MIFWNIQNYILSLHYKTTKEMIQKLRFINSLNKILLKYSNRIKDYKIDAQPDFVDAIIIINSREGDFEVTVQYDDIMDSDLALYNADVLIREIINK